MCKEAEYHPEDHGLEKQKRRLIDERAIADGEIERIVEPAGFGGGGDQTVKGLCAGGPTWIICTK